MILYFIKELARYEEMLHEVNATEDLYVKPEYRNKGYGKALLKNWLKLQLNVGVADWNGGVWIGISLALISIYR